MTTVALDTSAVLAWILQEEPHWRAMDEVVRHPDIDAVLPGPAITEVVVVARRCGNTSSPALITRTLDAMNIRVEAARKPDLLRAAELLEASSHHPGSSRERSARLTLSLADAVILSIVERLEVPVITFDHYWLQFAAAGFTSAHIITA